MPAPERAKAAHALCRVMTSSECAERVAHVQRAGHVRRRKTMEKMERRVTIDFRAKRRQTPTAVNARYRPAGVISLGMSIKKQFSVFSF